MPDARHNCSRGLDRDARIEEDAPRGQPAVVVEILGAVERHPEDAVVLGRAERGRDRQQRDRVGAQRRHLQRIRILEHDPPASQRAPRRRSRRRARRRAPSRHRSPTRRRRSRSRRGRPRIRARSAGRPRPAARAGPRRGRPRHNGRRRPRSRATRRGSPRATASRAGGPANRRGARARRTAPTPRRLRRRPARSLGTCNRAWVYLSSRDRRRSLSTLPSVWQVGQ